VPEVNLSNIDGEPPLAALSAGAIVLLTGESFTRQSEGQAMHSHWLFQVAGTLLGCLGNHYRANVRPMSYVRTLSFRRTSSVHWLVVVPSTTPDTR